MTPILERELTSNLCRAAQRNDPGALDAALDAGGNPNRANPDGWTPLRCAATCGSADALRLLLERGADVYCGEQVEHGTTYLHHAAASGNEECVRLLLAAGCSVTARDRFGRTPIFAALEKLSELSATASALVLLEAGSDPVSPDNYGTTPLHLAAENGYTFLVGVLLRAGADPNAADVGRATPLHRAVQRARFIAAEDAESVVAQLLAASANPNLATHPAYAGEGGTMLHFAAHSPAAILRQLLAAGAEVNALDKRKQTPLMLMLENADNFAVLLEAGADVTPLLAVGGKPALLTAVEAGNMGAVTALLAAGADPDKPYRNKLPLHAAITKGYTEAVGALLKGGADPTLPDKDGTTPLERAIKRRRKAIIMLVEAALSAHTVQGIP